MSLASRLQESQSEFVAWRHDLHAHPETAFEEKYTSDFVAARLQEMGIPLHRGLAGTGVVGTLTVQQPGKPAGGAIALRADMDALDIEEKTGLPYRSTLPGKMHACGHDGHTTMLLAAAKYLSQSKNFHGTVHFVFQPAEENEGGGRVMVEQGLFDKFPATAVFGMHNWPGVPVGQFAVRPGPMMAAFDIFEIIITGKGAHAAMPHLGIDPLTAAAQVVTALQTIASRNTDPLDSSVVSVTQIHGGDTWNVIPETAVLRGTCRSFRKKTQDMIEEAMRRIVAGVCSALGTTATVRYERRYPVTANTSTETEWCAAAAAAIVGKENVLQDLNPCMGGEDFSFMLEKRPGCYIWVGNGPTDGNRTLHNPHYDFNDAVIPIGAGYWSQLVENLLPAK